MELIDLAIDRLDKALQIPKRCRYIRIRFTSLLKQSRQLSLGIGIRNVRCIETDTVLNVNLKKLANTPPKHRTDQDIGIKNKHLANGTLAATA